MKLCATVVGVGAGLVDCVVELAAAATTERVARRTPADAALPSLELAASDATGGRFRHLEDADLSKEAAAHCAGSEDADACAAAVASRARRKAAAAAVDAESAPRRAAIEQAVEASLKRAPALWDKVRQRRRADGWESVEVLDGSGWEVLT